MSTTSSTALASNIASLFPVAGPKIIIPNTSPMAAQIQIHFVFHLFRLIPNVHSKSGIKLVIPLETATREECFYPHDLQCGKDS